MAEEIPSKLCGRALDWCDLQRIRFEIEAANPPLREEVARRVCVECSPQEQHEWVEQLSERIRNSEHAQTAVVVHSIVGRIVTIRCYRASAVNSRTSGGTRIGRHTTSTTQRIR